MKTSDAKKPPRFLIADYKGLEQTIGLTEDQMHYASRVLRLKDETLIQVWNGEGQDFLGKLRYLSKKEAEIHIQSGPLAMPNTELNRPLWLAQGLPEGDKMDWIIEKCTELGASAFWPVQAQRSVVRLQPERAEKRQQHWQRIVQAASLQSGRNQLAKVHSVQTLEEQFIAIKTLHPNAELLWFTPQANQSLQNWVDQQPPRPLDSKLTPSLNPLILYVGPEGGWTLEETRLAISYQATMLKFSSRVLRTETFGLACIAQLTVLLGLDPT